jgi:glutamine amidotransferase
MSTKQKIVIVDYGVGNVHSVYNAISLLGYKKIKISALESDIKNADSLILPGVGAFDEAIRNLKSKNLIPILNQEVLIHKKPILGICVGMQMLAEGSDENGWHDGLGWIKGKISKITLPPQYTVPHVGWNEVNLKFDSPLLKQSQNKSHFYFDHSYHFEGQENNILAYCDYGKKITAAIFSENIFGVQFHPEKSQTNGLKLFRNFFNITSC